MSRNIKPNASASNKQIVPKSQSTHLVTKAYNNQIIVKNEDGEYAPVGN